MDFLRSSSWLTRAIIIVLVVGMVSLVSGIILSSLIAGKLQSEPYPAQGLLDQVSEGLKNGVSVETLQKEIDTQASQEPRLLSFLVVDRSSRVVAGHPRDAVGSDFPYLIRRVSQPIKMFPQVIVSQGGSAAPGLVMMQNYGDNSWRIITRGYDPDDGRVAMHNVYLTGQPGGDYMIISSWVRSDAVFQETEKLQTMRWWSEGLLRVCFLVFWLLLPWWVYRDARKRRVNPIAWGMLTLFTNVVGWAVYLIARPNLVRCSTCRTCQDASFSYCPACGQGLKPVCGQCRQPVEADWEYCAGCGNRLE